jgi:hypothetical protein
MASGIILRKISFGLNNEPFDKNVIPTPNQLGSEQFSSHHGRLAIKEARCGEFPVHRSIDEFFVVGIGCVDRLPVGKNCRRDGERERLS